MSEIFEIEARRAIRTAMARLNYDNDVVRLAEPDVSRYDWLVATHRDVYAVNLQGAQCVIYGWFFGICRMDEYLFLFENCAMRNRSVALGRIIRLTIKDGRISDPAVMVKGLDANCHQIAVIDGLLCVVDTANQSILRFTLDGALVDIQTPFPIAPATDRSGVYLHINSVAQVGDRIAVMVHNGKALPQRRSELAWLDMNWRLSERSPLDGHCCHDIVRDENGAVWHSASSTGEIMSSDGRRVKIDDDRMTRGLALTAEAMIVGISSFGPRQNRDALPGAVVIMDRAFNRLAEIELRGPPADIVAI